MTNVEWVMTEKVDGQFIVEYADYKVVVRRNLGVTLMRYEQTDEGEVIHRIEFPDYVGFIKAMRALDRVVTGTYGPVD